MIEVALYQPEIPPNTGNIGRLCVGYGVRLGLIGPIGFSLEEKALRRAGLDYWPKLEFEVFTDFDSFWERRVLQGVLPHSESTQKDKVDPPQNLSIPHDRVVSAPGISMPHERRRVICLSKHGTCLLHDWTFQPGDVLLMGNETRGVPFDLSERYELERISIPMSENIRSYNLANAAAIAISEAYRQLRWSF